MRPRVIFYLFGLLIVFLGVNMLASMAWSLYYGEPQWLDFLFTIVGTFIVGGGLIWRGWSGTNFTIYKKEALMIVSGSWIISGLFGAVPLYISGYAPCYIDAFFEIVSGFTTTGASILSNVEVLPKGLLFWRSYTHWLGGMGIIVLFVALIPFVGASGKKMYQFEAPGPDVEGIKPTIQLTSLILWAIYIGFTLLESILLMLAGMPLFDALCHTFGTMGTGGFSTKNASIAYYSNPWIHIIILVFMISAGTNFTLYYYFFKRKTSLIWRDSEYRVYLIITLISIAIVSGLLIRHRQFTNWDEAFLYGSFNTVSVMTTTGYATADFDQWSDSIKIILFALMFIGGCGGSTAGGIKIIRFIILVKYAYNQIIKSYVPHRRFILRVSNKVIDKDVVKRTLSYFFLHIFLFIGGVILMGIAGTDWISAFSSVAACLNNIGPGFGQVGPLCNYGFLPGFAKLALSFFMIAGRLEIYALLVLFIPDYWRR